MEQPSLLGTLITFALMILIMAGGFSMLVSSVSGQKGLTGRMYGWIFQNVFLAPLRWLGREAERYAIIALRWLGRQLWELFLALCRLIGRGVRAAWVRVFP